MAPALVVRCARCRREHNAKLAGCPFCGAAREAPKPADGIATTRPDPALAVGARLRLQARALSASGQTDEALIRIGQALDHDPSDLEATLLKASLEAVAGRHRSAIDAFDAALSLDPGGARVHADKAASYEALGLLEDALGAHDQYLRRAPDDASALEARDRVARGIAAQPRGELMRLRWAMPRERISGLGPRALFSLGSDPRGYFALKPDSAYSCPRCQARHVLDAKLFLDHGAAGAPRSPLAAATDRSFARLGVAKGFDLACACGLEVRLDFEITEHPSRSCDYIPCVRDVLERWPQGGA